MAKRTSHITLAAFTSIGLALGPAPTAIAETLECTEINAVPMTINVQGVYCLFDNIATSITTGHAIEITTSNVTIDLNGWKLGGLGAGDGTNARGIYSSGPNNITIRNGSVRGFHTGVELLSGQGHLVEDVRAEGNRAMGIRTSGDGSVVRRNQVVDTGGSTSTSTAIGIQVSGGGPRVLNNEVDGVAASSNGLGYGIYALAATNSIIQDNRVTGVSADTGASAGIAIGLADALVEHNLVSALGDTPDYGIYFVLGIGGYRNNIVYGADTAYSGGTNLGDNDSL